MKNMEKKVKPVKYISFPGIVTSVLFTSGQTQGHAMQIICVTSTATFSADFKLHSPVGDWSTINNT